MNSHTDFNMIKKAPSFGRALLFRNADAFVLFDAVCEPQTAPYASCAFFSAKAALCGFAGKEPRSEAAVKEDGASKKENATSKKRKTGTLLRTGRKICWLPN